MASTDHTRAGHIATLGRCWTTRIVAVPDERLVSLGPFRFLRHSNYAAVAAEILALVMVFGLIPYAITFGPISIAILAWRIKAENAAFGLQRTTV